MAKKELTSRENGKKGGRPVGSVGKKTLEKQAAQEYYRERVMEKLDPLIEAQLACALGYFKFEMVGVGKKKERIGGYWTKPDAGTIDSVLSRALGKPKDGMSDLGEGMAELGKTIRTILDGKKTNAK